MFLLSRKCVFFKIANVLPKDREVGALSVKSDCSDYETRKKVCSCYRIHNNESSCQKHDS